jgi:glycine cleavage system aminomethyltransferase T
MAKAGTPLEVTIVGERRSCRVLAEPPVDPKGARMRA